MTFFSVLGRWVGFLALAGVATATLAGCVLLPAWARVQRARYRAAVLQAQNDRSEALVAAYDRAIDRAQDDPVLTRRLAGCQLGMWPGDEIVVIDPANPPERPPVALQAEPLTLPQPPSPRWLTIADRLANPTTRSWLIGLSLLGLAGAIVLFTGPTRQHRKSKPSSKLPRPMRV